MLIQSLTAIAALPPTAIHHHHHHHHHHRPPHTHTHTHTHTHARYIIGQGDAKKAVAVAFRNRWRRHRVPDASMREDIIPKNILMIGESATARPSLM